jgi:hypothetical protein
MKKIKILLSFILMPVIFSGCLQVETTLFVKKDGSGTINEKVLFSKTFVNMIKDFAQAFQDSSSTEEFNLYEEENIVGDAKDYGDNVVYVSHEKIDNDNWEGYQVIYSFDDVTKIKIAPDPDSKIDLEEEAVSNGLHKEFYFFKFIKDDTPQLIIDRPDIELSSDSNENSDSTNFEQNDEEEGEEYVKLMEGMKIDISVQVDGEIESTNATYVDGSRVTLFQMDFGEMMKNKEAFKEFKKNEPKNIDELKLYLDKLDGIKIEVKKPITINFK